MKFSILFCARTGYSINIDCKNVGINLLEMARTHSGINFDSSILVDRTRAKKAHYTIYINEDLAKLSSQFLNDCHIVVHVPTSFLNAFCDFDLDIYKDSNSGEFLKVEILYKLNETKLIEYWINSNFSLDF